MSEDAYFKWYDEDHIDEIVNTDGIKNAYRYIDTNPKADKPYLAFYPMTDIGFTQGERFKKIRVKSSLLPGTGICYDLADIDVRYLGLIDKIGSRKGVSECLVTIGIEPGPNSSDSEVESWFKSDVGSPQRVKSQTAECRPSNKQLYRTSQATLAQQYTDYSTLERTRNQEL